jgi:O-antigen/teichoic acid export membrane protein
VNSLGQKATSAVIWNAGFNIFRDLLQFAVMLVLVRLLAVEAYGQFSLVTSIIAFLGIFSFNSFIAHSLQVRADEEANFQQHFAAGAVLQVGMFIVTNLVALALRWIPKYEAVAPLVHVMSVTFLLEWPCELRRKMIERQFDWRTLRILHGIGLLANAALAITMAVMGAGVYALLVPGLIVTLPFIYDLFVRQRWRPTWEWSWRGYKSAWNFGVTRMGSGLTLNGRQLLESGVLSAVLGFAALGVLNRSMGLAQLFCYKLATQLIYAIYPVLTRVEGGVENAQRVGSLVLRAVAWTVLPTAVCFGVLAKPVVQTVYGEKWMGVVPLLPWAMGWGAAAAMAHACYMLLLSRQQTKKCFVADVLSFVGTAMSLWFVLPFGVVKYLASAVCVQGVIVGLLTFWLRGVHAISRRGIAEAFLPALLAGSIAALGATALLRFVFVIEPDSFWRAVGWGAVFLAVYVAVLRFGFVDQLKALIHYFPARATVCRLLALKPST